MKGGDEACFAELLRRIGLLNHALAVHAEDILDLTDLEDEEVWITSLVRAADGVCQFLDVEAVVELAGVRLREAYEVMQTTRRAHRETLTWTWEQGYKAGVDDARRTGTALRVWLMDRNEPLAERRPLTVDTLQAKGWRM